MTEPEAIAGYVRCDVLHKGAELSIEVLSERPKVALLVVETSDGDVQCALNREAAVKIAETLKLFLEDWPEGQAGS